jgi:phosphatidylserine synthase
MALDRKMLRQAVPNALTLGNGICGVAGLMVLSGEGPDKIRIAAALIFAGWLFDMVDGIAARRLGAATALGAALDSLCDAVTFAALPAILLCARHEDIAAVVCAIVFACGALLRLARYMAHASHDDGPRWFFDGLPSPAAAMIVATGVLLDLPQWQGDLVALITAAAMVSRLPYADLPHFYLAKRLPWVSALVPLVAVAAVGAGPVAAAIFVIYLLSGPAVYLARRRNADRKRA